MLKLRTASLAYFFSSVFIGPALVIYALGRGRVGFDCSDSTWTGVSGAIKTAYYNDATNIMRIVSVAAIVIGLSLALTLLVKTSHKDVRFYNSLFIISLAILGYIIIIAQANSWSCMIIGS